MPDGYRICRSCRSPIIFAFTEKGRRMPLDADPNPDGNMEVVLSPDGVRFVYPADDDTKPEDRYMPHHASCPDGRTWSRKHKGKGAARA